jgi:catechol 2,3-dioxygenase-like lactoylglutathione lyase family enzyme
VKPTVAKKRPVEVRLDRIGLFILYCRDAMKSAAFYRDVLGMRVVEATPHWAGLDGGGVHLALHPHPSMPAERGTASPWVVFTVDDVRGVHAALVEKGIRFDCEPREVCSDESSSGLSADFKDPDGNLLSIFGKVPK